MYAQAPHSSPAHSPARHTPAGHPAHPAHPSRPKSQGHRQPAKPAKPTHPTVAHRQGHKPAPAKQSAPRGYQLPAGEEMPVWMMALASGGFAR